MCMRPKPLVHGRQVGCVILDLQWRAAEPLPGKCEISVVVVNLDRAIAHFNARQIRRDTAARPNLNSAENLIDGGAQRRVFSCSRGDTHDVLATFDIYADSAENVM